MLLLGSFIVTLAVYENRQKVYDQFAMGKYSGDFVLQMPSEKGRKILADFTNKYQSIAMVSLIDADPVDNTRRLIYRSYKNQVLQKIMEDNDRDNPGNSGGPLFTSNAENNKQILAIMNGEFFCAPGTNSILSTNFQGADKIVVYQCRVPLPPAFNKATGWFTIHLTAWPDSKIDEIKFDALSMSLAYYNTEIAEKGKISVSEK